MGLFLVLDNEPFRMGRIVHFIDGLGKQHPMLLTSVHKSGTNGKHFANGAIFDYRGFSCVIEYDIPYDTTKKPMTWHWPSRMERKKDLKKVAKAGTK